ncbi:MAG: c-type cytochrome [Campylobacterales bacterium]|nr:c-type cytochrome [Campylobacterales bacterium]
MKIVISTLVAFLLLGCSDQESTSKVQEEVAQKTVEVVEQETPQVVKEPEEVVQESVEEVKKETTEVVKVVEKEVAPIKSLETPKVVEKAPVVATVKPDGAVLFKACISCHGVNAEKKALNKSQIIQGWESTKVVNALHGYKDGSYGGPMKAIMKGQVTKLSDEDIKALGDYISGL